MARLLADPKVSLQTNTLRVSLNGFDSTASATCSNCRYSKAFLAGTSLNLSGVVEIDEFAVFPLPYLQE